MAKYRNIPEEVEAVTFQELVEFGIAQVGKSSLSKTNMPWSFEWCGNKVTHENDERYIVTGPNGSHNVESNDVLVMEPDGRLAVYYKANFDRLYQPI